MVRKSRQDPALPDFILRNVEEHPSAIVSLTMEKFGYSRPAVLRYVQRLIAEGFLTAKGNTYARRYALKPLAEKNFRLPIDYLWTEDDVWRKHILPLIKGVRPNVADICQYGFTEMLNNALEHARSPEVHIRCRRNYNEIAMMIVDQGIGIFEKIQNDFNLSDPRAALLELSKGRLTSDKKHHAGEGIFFTSRMFDSFRIRSSTLFYTKERRNDDEWLIETTDKPSPFKGTMIYMCIKTDASWTKKEVFEKYLGDNWGFRKTHVPVKLALYPGEQLVSRSQAKRLLARFDNFSEVFLDFNGVEEIGQPFADEIFRVFPLDHPGVEIQIAHANEGIRKMIAYVRANRADA